MSTQERRKAIEDALDKPMQCVGGPLDGTSHLCRGAAGLACAVQSETERFYWDDKWGLMESRWDEAVYEVKRGDDDMPVLRFKEIKLGNTSGKLLLERQRGSSLRMMTDDTAIVRLAGGGIAMFTKEELAEMHEKGLP